MNTEYDNDATQFADTPEQKQNAATEAHNGKTVKTWKRAAVGAGGGLLIGGLATGLMGMTAAGTESETPADTESDNNSDGSSNPEWVDDRVQVASSVNDGMSFNEAFAAAREEVGPGGCFEWHGQVYGTYTADEWNGMTAEERSEYSDHFSWSHIDRTTSDVAQHSTISQTGNDSHTGSGSHTTTTGANHQETPAGGDDIEVISVNHDQNPGGTAQTTGTEIAGNTGETGGSADVEILGVTHDAETGANIGAMTVDGHEVILIDVDGNMEFDYMAADQNGNGEIEQGEMVDIQGSGLTVADLGGLNESPADYMASNDTPDYSTDQCYEG